MRCYPCQLIPLGATLSINHGKLLGAKVIFVVQIFNRVEVHTDKGVLHMTFDQCAYVEPTDTTPSETACKT